jgi:hypothetical protein
MGSIIPTWTSNVAEPARWLCYNILPIQGAVLDGGQKARQH